MNKSTNQKRVFITWANYDSRSYSLAHHLKAKNYFIQSLSGKSYLNPFRYIINSFWTINILRKENPDVVIVANPPIFAVIVVWAYCFFFDSVYIVDTHSCAFTTKRWAFFLWLYKFLAKYAVMNILHNEVLDKKVAKWEVPTFNLGEVQFLLDVSGKYKFQRGFNVVFVSLFADDEPLEEVLRAAQMIPSVNFYITGSLSKAPKHLVGSGSKNVVFTDYLSDKKYGALLKGCDIVMSLTIKDMTMQNGAYEALALGRPIITSDWSVLKNTYYKGAVCIDNSPESIVKAILKIKDNYKNYLNEVKELREELLISWKTKLEYLIETMNASKSLKSFKH